jgi:hypothetical protein
MHSSGKIRHVVSCGRERAIAGAGVDGDEPRAVVPPRRVMNSRRFN